ncbi:helix-turn-helix domain-containing protein, partial [Streptomyces pharetrae]|uniref:helix-turn-helix domain-containing protein n=1 Tax=Streptomyces pharetrae TaxID=291370 RepID=UPI0036C534BA
FETAHDLAGLRDLDAVLQAIVQRARSLLGTDVAYLSLHDPARGDTYMRVTEGSVAARFQQLRLGMGEGLGGLVAQTARPYVTDDYFQDDRFQHTSSIDAGVRDEGLVAILGVPLMLGPHVIGVLFAADRRARVFEREQIALLGSFAALAAAAIDTANLLTETRSALAGLERANEIIQDRSAVIERASEVHDRLAELVLRGGGVHDVAAAVSEVLDGTVEFTEPVGAPARALDESRAEGHAVRHQDDWIAAVAAGGELLGALVLRGHPGLDPVDQRTLERAAMVTSLLLLAGERDVTGFVDRTIGPVVEYDERRGTELLRTLDAYFDSGMSPARTKDALHVHVNTVAQRLERVGRLLGDDWQSPSRALEIQLALRLHRLSAPERH